LTLGLPRSLAHSRKLGRIAQPDHGARRATAGDRCEHRATVLHTALARGASVSSLPEHAERLLAIIRSNWGVENELHWCLDVAFREDDSRIRKGDGAQNFSFLRRLALTLLKREKTAKMGLKAKRHKAGWDNDYLLSVLAAS
jgi:predicted transposase YbfD/YdcC